MYNRKQQIVLNNDSVGGTTSIEHLPLNSDAYEGSRERIKMRMCKSLCSGFLKGRRVVSSLPFRQYTRPRSNLLARECNQKVFLTGWLLPLVGRRTWMDLIYLFKLCELCMKNDLTELYTKMLNLTLTKMCGIKEIYEVKKARICSVCV